MAIPPTPKPAYPNVPVAPGVPPVNRQPGFSPSTIVGLVADAAQIIQLFQAPQWGIYDLQGNPVLASASTVQQLVASIDGTLNQIGSLFGASGAATFACSVGDLDFRWDYRISSAPQEQGAFLSYNKVQNPFDGRMTFLVGGAAAQRAAFLSTVNTLVASMNLYALVMPELTYPSINITHYDFRRTSRSGVSLLAVGVWFEQVRVSGTTAYSNTTAATPSGANAASLGNVQPVSPSGQQAPTTGANVT